MDKRTLTGVVTALLLATAAVYFMLNTSSINVSVFPVMGTICECRFEMPEHKFVPAVKAVHRAFDRVMKIADLYDKTSELSRLNATAHLKPFVCSKELYSLLRKSREAHRISEGKFDISVKPLMLLWGFYRKQGKAPSEQEIAAAKKLCGLDKVIFDDSERSVFFTQPGMALDLGGIAKGYALDLAKEELAPFEKHISRGTLNLGGNILLLGKKQTYNIGIKHPAHPDKIKEVAQFTSPGAISSSGDYERFVILDGKKYGHIIDPQTGVPASRNYAATVFAPSGTDSDWMSTTLYLGGTNMQSKLDCQSRIVYK